MSSDIVTRLRGAGSWLITDEWTHDPLCRDAAKAIEARDAEIEQLREQNEHLKANVEMLLAEAREKNDD